MPAGARGPWKDCIMHCRRYHNIHCLWNGRFVPCAFDCDAERGLLLHTPTFSARPGADGLETFSLFFYSSLLFFFFQGQRLEMFSAKSKAALYWLQRSFVSHCWQEKKKKRLIFEVTLLTWPLSKIFVAKNKQHTRGCSLLYRKTFKMLYCGGGREKEMKRGKNRWRHSTSLLK